eukprot:SAG31_NODE_12125_length_966_cov_1.102653_2_plen_178_part_01
MKGSNSSSTVGMVDPNTVDLNQNLYRQSRLCGGGAGSTSDYADSAWHYYFKGAITVVLDWEARTLNLSMRGKPAIHITEIPPGHVFAVDLFNGASCTVGNVRISKSSALAGGKKTAGRARPAGSANSTEHDRSDSSPVSHGYGVVATGLQYTTASSLAEQLGVKEQWSSGNSCVEGDT